MDLAEELREVVARVRREHPARSVSLSAPESLEIVADRDRIAQVLGNLVDNALKYSPHGGPISLSASREADGVAVAVADAGLGISPEQRELVFERFYQADDDAGRGRSTGLGLGLYICRAIVESHGGWIRAAATEAAPRGTVVTFRLPLVAEPSLPPLTIDEVPPFVVRSGGDTER
jgi:signal transduction histidine kinase